MLSEALKIPLIFIYIFQDSEVLTSQFNVYKPEVIKYYDKLIRHKYNITEATSLLIKFGKTCKQIIAAAKKLPNPLIIAGHKGQSSLSRFFLGSTAEKLALESPYPVWIHRGDAAVRPKNILIPCDLGERSLHAVAQVNSMLKILEAKSELFHVEPVAALNLDYEAYASFADQIKEDELRKLNIFKKKYPQLKVVTGEGAIVDQIQERLKKFDMIAMTPKENLKSKPFFGSVTSKLVRMGDKPILIAP